jgi:hypothetical protein
MYENDEWTLKHGALAQQIVPDSRFNAAFGAPKSREKIGIERLQCAQTSKTSRFLRGPTLPLI